MDSYSIAIRCPSCGHIVEAEARRGAAVFAQADAQLHPECSWELILAELSSAARFFEAMGLMQAD